MKRIVKNDVVFEEQDNKIRVYTTCREWFFGWLGKEKLYRIGTIKKYDGKKYFFIHPFVSAIPLEDMKTISEQIQ